MCRLAWYSEHLWYSYYQMMKTQAKPRPRTMASPPQVDARQDAILVAAAELLGVHGYDGLQVADVARVARVSLRTVYQHFPSRQELVVAAMERWSAEHVYVAPPGPRADEPLADRLVRLLRARMSSFIENPTMLDVVIRAVQLPQGDRLWQQGVAAAELSYFDGYDESLAADLGSALTYLTHGLLCAVARGRIAADEMLEVYERTVRLLTEDA